MNPIPVAKKSGATNFLEAPADNNKTEIYNQYENMLQTPPNPWKDPIYIYTGTFIVKWIQGNASVKEQHQ